MKVVCLSDTHLRHSINVPDGDVLVHAGDFTMRGSAQEVDRFASWLEKQPHQHKIVVAGNHDFLFEESPGEALSLLRGSCTYLKDSGTTIDGIKFYGAPWQPWFHNWAFNVPRNSEQMRRIWKQIPEGVDVLITHGPPHGIRDVCPDEWGRGLVSVGCEVLRDEIFGRVKPKVHIFGHIHEGAGQEVLQDILFVNAAVCDRQYHPTNPVQVIEL